jgi:hypothetical protein
MATPARHDAYESLGDPERITRYVVPCSDSLMAAVAGYNGNVGSYYYVVRWTGKPTPDSAVGAGDLEMEGGYPLGLITELAALTADLMDYIDLESPDLVLVLHQLLMDKTIDAAAHLYAENPYGNKLLPTIMGKVLDQDFTPVVEQRLPDAPSMPPELKKAGAQRRSRFWKT